MLTTVTGVAPTVVTKPKGFASAVGVRTTTFVATTPPTNATPVLIC